MVVEVTRRTALQGFAAAVGGRPVGSVAPASVTVATRNLYLGADLFGLFLDREGSAAATVGSLLDRVDASAVGRRMDTVAAELASTRPDVVGLQEVAHIRTERPSDGAPGGDPDATTTRYDFLELLREALADRGVAYDVAAISTNTDAEFPGLVDGNRIDVRLTGRDVLLVRQGTTDVTATTTATYDAALTVPVDDGFTLSRGYAAANLRVDGVAFTAVTTHLEPASAGTRAAQAEELRSAFADRSPVVVLGDLNDGPPDEHGAYEVLAGAFADAATLGRSDASTGPTCCFPPSLRDGEAATALTDRYDVVLSRGFTPTGARRVGIDPAARVEFEGDLLWPSDHAGVVATLERRTDTGNSTTEVERSDTPTAPTDTASPPDTSPSASPTETRESTPEAEPTETMTATGAADPTTSGVEATEPTASEADAVETTTTVPGFGAVAAAAGALIAGARFVVRSNEET